MRTILLIMEKSRSIRYHFLNGPFPNPYSSTLNELAARIGVEKSRFEDNQKGCILCGQCVRVCREVVGVSAIGYKSRGYTREVATPFDGPAVNCIACGSWWKRIPPGTPISSCLPPIGLKDWNSHKVLTSPTQRLVKKRWNRHLNPSRIWIFSG